MYGKGFLGNMTENLHADCVQSRQAGFIQCFLYLDSSYARLVQLSQAFRTASSILPSYS